MIDPKVEKNIRAMEKILNNLGADDLGFESDDILDDAKEEDMLDVENAIETAWSGVRLLRRIIDKQKAQK